MQVYDHYAAYHKTQRQACDPYAYSQWTHNPYPSAQPYKNVPLCVAPTSIDGQNADEGYESSILNTHNEGPAQHCDKIQQIHKYQPDATNTRLPASIPSSDRCEAPITTRLPDPHQARANRHPARHVRKGPTKDNDATRTSPPNHVGTNGAIHTVKAYHKGSLSRVPRMEDSIEMGRRTWPNHSTRETSQPKPDSDTLRYQHEDFAGQCIRDQPPRGHRTGPTRHTPLPSPRRRAVRDETQPSDYMDPDGEDCSSAKKDPPVAHSTLHQSRSHSRADASGRNGRVPRRARRSPRKTQKPECSANIIHRTVCTKPSGLGSCPTHSEVHDSALATEHNDNSKYKQLSKKNTSSGKSKMHRLPGLSAMWQDAPYAEDDVSLPLHCSEIGASDMDRLKQIAADCYSRVLNRWTELTRCITDGQYVDSLAEKANLQHTLRATSDDRTTLCTKDQSTIVQSGMYRISTSITARRLWGKLFTRTERRKQRRRLLYWPRELNELLREDFDIIGSHVGDSVASAAHVQPGTVARAYDLTRGFFQFPIAPEAQPKYSADMGGRVVECERMPMGLVPAADICTTALEIVADPCNPKWQKLSIDIHVDNIRAVALTTDAHILDEFDAELRKRSASANLTFTDEYENSQHVRGQFCGMLCDYHEGVVRCSDGLINKVKDYSILQDSAATFDDVYKFFSTQLAAARILRYPLFALHHVLKFIRRRLSAWNKAVAEGYTAKSDTRANIWPSVIDQWLTFSHDIAQNPWVNHPHDERTDIDAVLYTDASTNGWGAMLISGFKIVAEAQGRWSNQHDCSEINELEMMAVAKAVTALQKYINNDAHVLIAIDNSASMSVLQKGHAQAYNLNEALIMVNDAFELLPSNTFTVAKVSTEDNPADKGSRELGDLLPGVSKSHQLSKLSPELGRLGQLMAGARSSIKMPARCFSPLVTNSPRLRSC